LALPARVQLNSKEVATGLGLAVLGNPLKSIAWLAGKLDQYGRPLRSDDIIMLASLVRHFSAEPGRPQRC
jgi:2-keto-4-pentenoate hydratase